MYTGDRAAYCADPQGVIDQLRSSGARLVMGNCEESLAAQEAGCGCGFADDTACAALSTQCYSHADQNDDAESRLWMGSLPRQLALKINGRRRVVLHGGVTSIDRFVFASWTEAIEEELGAVGYDGGAICSQSV